MYKVNKVGIFINQGRISADGLASLYISTTAQGAPVRIPVGIRCRVENIDFERNIILPSEPNHEDMNLIISASIARITDIFVRYRLQWKQLTKDQLLKEYGLLTATKDFHTYARYKLEEHTRNIEEGTYRRHESQLNKIAEYSPQLKLQDIDKRWVKDYIS
jgi:hypothetical protein